MDSIADLTDAQLKLLAEIYIEMHDHEVPEMQGSGMGSMRSSL